MEGTIIPAEPKFVTLRTQYRRTTQVTSQNTCIKLKATLAWRLSHGYIDSYIKPSERIVMRDLDPTVTCSTDIATDACACILSARGRTSQHTMQLLSSKETLAAKDNRNSASRVNTHENGFGTELTIKWKFKLEKSVEDTGSRQPKAKEPLVTAEGLKEKAMMEELRCIWVHAYEKVQAVFFDKSANVIGSHMVFKIKDNYDQPLLLKSRSVLDKSHGNNALSFAETLRLQIFPPFVFQFFWLRYWNSVSHAPTRKGHICNPGLIHVSFMCLLNTTFRQVVFFENFLNYLTAASKSARSGFLEWKHCSFERTVWNVCPPWTNFLTGKKIKQRWRCFLKNLLTILSYRMFDMRLTRFWEPLNSSWR